MHGDLLCMYMMTSLPTGNLKRGFNHSFVEDNRAAKGLVGLPFEVLATDQTSEPVHERPSQDARGRYTHSRVAVRLCR